MEFHLRLKELRAQRGISQRELAEQIHISRSAVAKWENGLGLPGEESLQLLASYFGVTEEELLPDHGEAAHLVRKNHIILRQKKAIFVLAALLGLVLVGVAAYCYKPFREYSFPFLLGILILALGIFNMKGNIASIHWYNRRKVTKENQKPYCRLVGLGTVVIGVATACFAVLESIFQAEWVAYIEAGGILVGLVFICYAQFKYNKGLF